MLTQRRRDAHAAAHREAQPVGLVRPVVRVLPEDHDLGAAYGVRWSAANTSSCGGTPGARRARRRRTLELVPVRLVELARRSGFQSVAAIGSVISMPSVFDHLRRARWPRCRRRSSGARVPGGARLWVKRDDLTGLGGGGNKARKLEFLCGDASAGAQALVTVGAAQSNHCRMTAAAGAVLGSRCTSCCRATPGDADGQSAAVDAVRCPAALHRRRGEPLGRARDRPGGARPTSWPATGSRRTRSRSAGAPPSARSGTRRLRRADRAVRRAASSRGDRVHVVERWHTRRPARRAARCSRSGAARCPTSSRSAWPRGSTCGMPDVAELADETLELIGVDAHGRSGDVESTPDGSATTTRADRGRRRAIRWAARAAAGCSTGRTRGKGFAGCSASPRRPLGRRRRRRVRPHRRLAGAVRP